MKKCSLAGEGVENINLENSSPFQVFTETIGLEGLLTLIKSKSERYAAKIGGVFQATNDELAAFLGVNVLMGINRLPAINKYWSAEEGLGNLLIQKAMTRARFWEILKNMHFAENLPQEIVSNMIVHGNSDLCLTLTEAFPGCNAA